MEENNDIIFVRPSSLRHTMLCPGSFYMEQGMPDVTSEAAQEGTMLHEVMAKSIVSGVLDLEGLTAEQTDIVCSCWDFLLAEQTEIGHSGHVTDSEVFLKLYDAEGKFVSQGTSDVVIRAEDSITIIDWKFGREEVIEACRNPQVAFYAAAAMQTYGVGRCKAIVYQPRLFRATEYTFTNLSQIISSVKAISDSAMDSTGVMQLCPSEEACRFCRAKNTCPAFSRAFKSLTSIPDPKVMAPEQLAKFYEVGQLVKRFIENDLEKAMGDYLDQHGSLAGYEWKEIRGRKEVTDIRGLAEEVSPLCTPDDFRDSCTVSLAKLYEKCEPSLQSMDRNAGGKGTKKDAKAKFDELTERYVGRGIPSRRIVKNTNKEN